MRVCVWEEDRKIKEDYRQKQTAEHEASAPPALQQRLNFVHFIIISLPINVQTKLSSHIFPPSSPPVSALVSPLLAIIFNKVPLNNYVQIKQTGATASPGTFNPRH